MIHVSKESVDEGMVIGKSIFDSAGTLLLGRGVKLNDFLLSSLGERGVESLYISDGTADEVIPHESISDVVRGNATQHMKGLFNVFEEVKAEESDQPEQETLNKINSSKFQRKLLNSPFFKKMIDDVHLIVDELIRGEENVGLNSIKTLDNYTFQHSLDVAVISILIGRKIGLQEQRLRELGIGCILHDIGKGCLSETILNKPGKLTDEEYEHVKAHTTIGFELIKGIKAIGLLPPHVALQHHEHQDGGGYPRGLKGDNNIIITQEAKSVHVYASICAVADMYDAMTSDRPFRKAFAPEEALQQMESVKGTHLNSEVFRYFKRITPLYPDGATVRVTTGEYKDYIGVVTQQNPYSFNRPVVKLVMNQGRQKLGKSVEINLLDDKETRIESVVL